MGRKLEAQIHIIRVRLDPEFQRFDIFAGFNLTACKHRHSE